MSLSHAAPAKMRQGASASKLQVKATITLPLTRQIQATPNQASARCSVSISTPASRSPHSYNTHEVPEVTDIVRSDIPPSATRVPANLSMCRGTQKRLKRTTKVCKMMILEPFCRAATVHRVHSHAMLTAAAGKLAPPPSCPAGVAAPSAQACAAASAALPPLLLIPPALTHLCRAPDQAPSCPRPGSLGCLEIGAGSELAAGP